MRAPRSIVALLLLAVSATACDDGRPQVTASVNPSATSSFKGAAASIETDEGSVLFEIEVARSPEEKARGLMGRGSLPEDHGMAFVFSEPTRGGFWMKDTKIPLSIAFIGSDGLIQEIQDMDPCLTESCPIFTPELPYDIALEVNRGNFQETGVEVGDKVTFSF